MSSYWNMTAAPQHQFSLDLPATRPLVPVDVAAFFLDTDHDGVIGRMEAGIISHAWDIGLGDLKRELRFYWRSLIAAKRETGDSTLECRATELTDAAVYADVIPTNWQRPRAASLYRRWSCSSGLVLKLTEAGELRIVTEARPGEYGSPEILRDSAISFLQRRRVR